MKKIRYIFSGLLSLLIVSSCDNFEALNTDSNKPTKVTANMLATRMLVDTYAGAGNANNFAMDNLFCKHTALVWGNATAYQYFYSSYPYGGFGSYKRFIDLREMVKVAEENGEEFANPYKGLELYMKAYYAFKMTIEMGDIPYTEAGQGDEGNLRPKYDKQEDVFKYILRDMEAAEKYFATSKTFKGDIIYDGDPTKWRKLCNAMQLKVLQTMSKKITTEQKTRFGEIVAANNLLVDNADNLLLVYTEDSKHPFEGYEGVSNTESDFISELAANVLKETKDRRLFIFAEPAKALLKDGKTAKDFDSYAGAPTEKSHVDLTTGKSQGLYSTINLRYSKQRAGEPMIHFTYAEQCFIIAEAIEEGWISGDSKSYYEAGVKAMLSYYMNLSSAQDYNHGMPITKDYIDNYFTGAAAYAATKGDRLKQVWMQRWLIDFFQGNGGNYPQVLRTGYPVFPFDLSTNMNPQCTDGKVWRWMYPEKELKTNTDNYKAAIQSQYGGTDRMDKKPWYLQ